MSEQPEVWVRKRPWWPYLWSRWEAKIIDVVPLRGYVTGYGDAITQERAIAKARRALARKMDPYEDWTQIE